MPNTMTIHSNISPASTPVTPTLTLTGSPVEGMQSQQWGRPPCKVRGPGKWEQPRAQWLGLFSQAQCLPSVQAGDTTVPGSVTCLDWFKVSFSFFLMVEHIHLQPCLSCPPTEICDSLRLSAKKSPAKPKEAPCLQRSGESSASSQHFLPRVNPNLLRPGQQAQAEPDVHPGHRKGTPPRTHARCPGLHADLQASRSVRTRMPRQTQPLESQRDEEKDPEPSAAARMTARGGLSCRSREKRGQPHGV